MAQPKTINGSSLLVQLGDGAQSETFAAPCLINADRGIAFSSGTNDIVVPDCDDPEAPAWVQRVVDGLSASVTGAGVVDTTNLGTFRTWFLGGGRKNIRVRVNAPSADGGGYWAMAAVLTDFSVTGTRGQKAAFDCTIVSDGPVTWTNLA